MPLFDRFAGSTGLGGTLFRPKGMRRCVFVHFLGTKNYHIVSLSIYFL